MLIEIIIIIIIIIIIYLYFKRTIKIDIIIIMIQIFNKIVNLSYLRLPIINLSYYYIIISV